MADKSCPCSPVRFWPALTALIRWAWLTLVVIRLAVDIGPRSAPGYDPRRKVVLCPKCGQKVRLEADGWGSCHHCGHEFDGSRAREA